MSLVTGKAFYFPKPIIITEKDIENYINVKNKSNQIKIQDLIKVFYPDINIDSNTIIKIEFKDKSSDICKDFNFDFTNKFGSLFIDNVSFIKMQFTNLEAEVIRFSNCQIDEISLREILNAKNSF